MSSAPFPPPAISTRCSKCRCSSVKYAAVNSSRTADIEIRDFAITHTRADTVTDIASLVGKSPVRTISPERPIREQEVVSPAIVKKNALVQMHYHSPGMEITTTGQAMTDGAKGDVINVRNVTSKKIVRDIVDNNGSVVIPNSGVETTQLNGGNYATN